MKNIWLSTVASALLAGSLFATDKKAEVQKIELEIAKSSYVRYDGAFKSAFLDGFEIGVGSGMSFKRANPDGSLEFYVISDRGPNGDSPELLDGDKKLPTKIFPSPNFAPSFGVIKVKDGKAELIELKTLKVNNKPISGRPLPNDMVGSTKEVALSDGLKPLSTDKNGMDPEAISVDRVDGNLWISDEYGPFVAKVDRKTGNVIKKYAPGSGLPELLKMRIPNRGAEGLSVAPNNKVYVMMQSILDVDGKPKNSNAQFIRLVELDPLSGKTRMFAYPHDVADYKASRDAKVGDITAISNTKFLVIEQGADKSKKMQNRIYMVDIERATDISGMKTSDGKELESAKYSELVKMGVRVASKKLVADLRELGWKSEKAEGIAVLDDYQTIAVISDNDFGMGIKVASPSKDKDGKEIKDPTDYVVDVGGTVMYGGTKSDARFEIVPSKEKAELWMLKLPYTLFSY